MAKAYNFKAWLIQMLRRVSYRYPPRYRAVARAKVGRNQYTCAKCMKVFGKKDTQVDHVIPVIDPNVGWVNWDVFIQRLFAEESGWQVLCKECHKLKTNEENATRRDVKKVDSAK